MARIIETPFGKLSIRTFSTGNVSILEDESEPLRINGIDYRPSGYFELRDYPDRGMRFVTFTHYAGMQRKLTYNASDKIRAWALDNWDTLADSAEQHASQIENAEWTLRRAEDALRDAEKAVSEARVALFQLQSEA